MDQLDLRGVLFEISWREICLNLLLGFQRGPVLLDLYYNTRVQQMPKRGNINVASEFVCIFWRGKRLFETFLTNSYLMEYASFPYV